MSQKKVGLVWNKNENRQKFCLEQKKQKNEKKDVFLLLDSHWLNLIT